MVETTPTESRPGRRIVLARLRWRSMPDEVRTVELWPGYGVTAPGIAVTNGHAFVLVDCLRGPNSDQVWEAVHPLVQAELTEPVALWENLLRATEAIAPQWRPGALDAHLRDNVEAMRERWAGRWDARGVAKLTEMDALAWSGLSRAIAEAFGSRMAALSRAAR